jgi:glycosyltransferase involved in cell wall biosynthesis
MDRKIESIGDSGTIRLLYLARLEREKGILELVDAVVLLLERGLDISLTIAGTGSVADELSEKVAALGERQNAICLAGYVRGNDKIDAFKSHHLFCFPTQYGEGMPNAVLEAMAFGLPVVTCPVGGIADFFENGKMGALLKDTAPETIANSIASLLEDRSSLLNIATYNYSYAQERFLASTVANFLRARYADIRLTH